MKSYPNWEVFDRFFSYDPSTGDITHKIKRGRCIVVGRSAVTATGNRGYRAVFLARKSFRAHRVAWMLHYRVNNPETEMDHINRNPGDNRIENLRLATSNENHWNKGLSSRNTSGVKGVSRGIRRNGKEFWAVSVTHHGVVHRFSCSSFEVAVQYCRELRERLHGEFANHG